MREDFQNLFYMSITTLIRKPFKDFTGKENYKKKYVVWPQLQKFLTEYQKIEFTHT